MGPKEHLEKLVSEFCSKVPCIKGLQRHEFGIKQVYPDHDRDEWRGEPGVYYFSMGKEVKYVGSGVSRWGVGYRVYKGLNKIGLHNGYRADPKPGWSDLLDGPDARVVILQFEESAWYWSLALEALLVHSLQPSLNRYKFRPLASKAGA